jgi:hypothetical protein
MKGETMQQHVCARVTCSFFCARDACSHCRSVLVLG